MNTEEETKFSSLSMKIPIFDGSDKSGYQVWEDDVIAVLEYHDIEEYLEDSWNDNNMTDETNTGDLAILQRKEIKKAKGILVRATSQLPNMIVKESSTPFEALSKLR